MIEKEIKIKVDTSDISRAIDLVNELKCLLDGLSELRYSVKLTEGYNIDISEIAKQIKKGISESYL